MLVKVNALPGAKDRPGVLHGNGKLGLRKGRADMRWHVIGSLVIVPVSHLPSIGYEPTEEVLQVGADVWGGILLHEQRGRGVTAPDCQQSRADVLVRYPVEDLMCDLIETTCSGRHDDVVDGLLHDLNLGDQRKGNERMSCMLGDEHRFSSSTISQ